MPLYGLIHPKPNPNLRSKTPLQQQKYESLRLRAASNNLPKEQQEAKGNEIKEKAKTGTATTKREAQQLLHSLSKGAAPVDNTNAANLRRIEERLLTEISELDASLTRMHKKQYRNGYLFDTFLTQELESALMASLQSNFSVEHHGFNVMRASRHENDQPTSLLPIWRNIKAINNKIEQTSAKNVLQFEIERAQFALKHLRKDWDYFSKGSQVNIISDSPTTKGRSRRKLTLNEQNFHEKCSRNKTEVSSMAYHPQYMLPTIKSHLSSPFSAHLTQPNISIDELHELLSKFRGKICSIWLPPSACPQLIGCFMFSVTSQLVLRLKKYWFLKHALKPRLFESVLDWAKQSLSLPLERIQLAVERGNYVKKWEKMGWKLRKWDKEGCYMIQYQRCND